MTDLEERIFQKYTALEGWVKRARDMTLLSNEEKLKEALRMIKACLMECEKLKGEGL